MTDRETAARIYRLFRVLRRQSEAWAAGEEAPEIAEGNPDVAAFNRGPVSRWRHRSDDALIDRVAAIIAEGRA